MTSRVYSYLVYEYRLYILRGFPIKFKNILFESNITKHILNRMYILKFVYIVSFRKLYNMIFSCQSYNLKCLDNFNNKIKSVLGFIPNKCHNSYSLVEK